MLGVVHAECRSFIILLSVVNAECYWAEAIMLGVTYAECRIFIILLRFIMLSVILAECCYAEDRIFIILLSFSLLSVIDLSVIIPSLVITNVVAPSNRVISFRPVPYLMCSTRVGSSHTCKY
jgi:hypothetical protein